jgi:oxygen-dependent protoporphyrinogen oxidase
MKHYRSPDYGADASTRLLERSAMKADCDVLVIGAGISGLTAAYHLVRRGIDVAVLDAAPRPGGVIGTERAHGLLYERGPNSILDTNPAINELLGHLGIRDERVDASATSVKRFVVRRGALVALPASPAAFLTTRLFSGRSKLRLLFEPFVGRVPPGVEESVAQFVVRRLGHEFLDYAIEPFVAGIYAGDPAQLSLPAAFPRLHALEQRYGSLVKGQIYGARERATRAEKSKRVSASFSFRDGLQTLTDALAGAVAGLRSETRATELRRTPDGVFVVSSEHAGETTQQRARAVVLAVSADRAAILLRAPAPDAARALDAIPYAAVATVASAYRRSDIDHPLDGFGFLAPRVEQRRVLGTLFSSSMFDGRAAKGAVLLTTYLGGQRAPDLASLPEAALANIAREELAALLGARGAPFFCAVTRWPRAIPQYTLGHLERVRCAERAETELPGLFLCASYRGGVAVGDCIASGGRTADRVARHLDSGLPAPADRDTG